MKYADIEAAVIDLLRRDLPALRSVEPYAGRPVEAVAKLPRRLPAAYVIYGGSHYEPVDGLSVEQTVSFTVVLAVRALDPESSPHELMGDLIVALANKNLGLDMDRLVPVSARSTAGQNSMLVYQAEFRARFDLDCAGDQ